MASAIDTPAIDRDEDIMEESTHGSRDLDARVNGAARPAATTREPVGRVAAPAGTRLAGTGAGSTALVAPADGLAGGLRCACAERADGVAQAGRPVGERRRVDRRSG